MQAAANGVHSTSAQRGSEQQLQNFSTQGLEKTAIIMDIQPLVEK